MRMSLRISLLAAVVIIAPAFSLGEVPDHAVVLIYHHVDAETPASTSVTPELFGEHLDYLVEGGYRAWPLAVLVDSLRSGAPVPDRTVAVTFDDGYRSVYTQAYPRLRELGWPFTVFVCPAAIDQRQGPVLTWDQMREMAAAGATVANHGLYHNHLQRRAAGESDEAWRQRTRGELLEAQRRIAKEMGEAPALFAYPYGEYDPDLQELIGDLGWAAFGQQSGPVGHGSDFTLLPRFPMGGPYASMETFGDKVASLPLPVVTAEPADPGIPEAGEALARQPGLRLTLAPGDYRSGQLAAFAGGQGKAELEWVDKEAGILNVRARKPLAPGRSRYNITAPDTDGRRYYWYSHTWIVGQKHRD